MELFSSLLLLIPLALFIWIEVVFYQYYLKTVEQNPDKQIRWTVFWAFKSLFGALPPVLLIIFIVFLADSMRGFRTHLDLLTGFIGLSLAIGVPLGLLWGVSRGAFRNYQKSNVENSYKSLGSVVIALFITFLFLLFVLLLIEALFFQGIGLEILAYLAFGWAPILFEQVSRLFQYWKVISMAILALFAFHGFMHWRKGFWKVSWTAGLAGTVFLIFLSGFAFIGATRHTAGVIQEPIVLKLSGRAYDSDTKSNLHNVYLACKAYWSDHGPDRSCNREIASGTTYGYVQSSAVRIQATGGEKEFRALATNINSEKWFWVDPLGTIRLITPSKRKS